MPVENRPRIALVTARAALGEDLDEPSLVRALRLTGAHVDICAWDEPSAEWAAMDLAVVRSAWDYAPRREEFLAWAAATAACTRLANPLDVLRWNTDKRYLRQLVAAGVPVVPTSWLAPGDAVRLPETGPFVVKPAVSAGGEDTARYAAGDVTAAADHAAQLLAAGRVVMVQPYLEAVDTAGETSLLYIADTYSHAIRKGPLLQPGAGPVAGLAGTERIEPREPTAWQRDIAEAALDAVPGGREQLLYARVDLVPGADGEPLLLELELTEPSLFLTSAAGSAERFAAAMVRAAS